MLYGKKTIGTIAYMGGVGSVYEDFCWSFAQMVQYNTEYLCEPGQIVHYNRAKVSYHAFARNTLVESMKGDWLLMLDTDHQFQPDMAARMVHQLNYHKIDVLVGLYQYKSKPYAPVLYRLGDDGKGYEIIGAWDKNVRLFEVGSSGAGCLLVRKSVYMLIRKKFKCGPFDIIPPFSEDHSFFRRLKKLGVKAYCDPNIECNHLAIKPITLRDFDRDSVKIGERKQVEGRI